MTSQGVIQLGAVLLGSVLAIIGGILTTAYREEQAQRRESRNLALAFKGEITALLELNLERGYIQRVDQVIQQIEQTGKPFYMPLRIRFQYDRVYAANVGRIGILKSSLPEQIPLFYTRLTSLLEDFVSISDGTYANLELEILVRLYRDVHKILQVTVAEGERLLEVIEREYPVN